MLDPRGGPISGAANWTSGFMPAAYQGTVFRAAGQPILNLDSASGMTSPMHCIVSKQRLTLECKPAPDAPTLWGRLFGWTQEACYYKLVVDFSQTEPQHQVCDTVV